MPRIFSDTDVRDIINLYQSGIGVQKIGVKFGCGYKPIARILTSNNIPIINRRFVRDLDSGSIIARFNAGESVKAIAGSSGVSRNVIVRILQENGVTPRNRSEGMYARMAATSPEERIALSAAAHAAVRGKRRTEEELVQRARTKERDLRFASRIEVAAAKMFLERGFDVCAQKAIGKYNVDLAISEPPIAVEIFGGNWHSGGRPAARFNERIEYILNSGWSLVIIWVLRDYPLEPGAIDYIIALAEELSRTKPVRGEKHVIRGDGNITTIGAANLKYRPIIPGPQPRDNVTGRYTFRFRE